MSNISNRPAELSCKWFNKTENSMNLIEGVTGSYYQPCLADVGTMYLFAYLEFMFSACLN